MLVITIFSDIDGAGLVVTATKFNEYESSEGKYQYHTDILVLTGWFISTVYQKKTKYKRIKKITACTKSI